MTSRFAVWLLIPLVSSLTCAFAASGFKRLQATLAGAPGAPPSEPAPAATKIVSIRIKNRDLNEVAHLLDTLRGARGAITVDAPARTIRIADRPNEVDRMARIVREIDESDVPGQTIRTLNGMDDPEEIAQVFTRVFLDSDPKPGVTISKIIPANREALLIVVADAEGHRRIWRARPYGCPDADTPRTVAIRLKNRDVHEVARLLDEIRSGRGHVTADASWGGLRITDRRENVYRMNQIIDAVDESNAPDQKVWFLQPVLALPAGELAQMLNRANEQEPEQQGVTLSKILADDRANLLIVVGNLNGYHRMTRLSRHICNHGCFEDRDRLDDVRAEKRLRDYVINVNGSAAEVVRTLDALSDHNLAWPANVKISAIVPDHHDSRIAIIADEAGYVLIKRLVSRRGIGTTRATAGLDATGGSM